MSTFLLSRSKIRTTVHNIAKYCVWSYLTMSMLAAPCLSFGEAHRGAAGQGAAVPDVGCILVGTQCPYNPACIGDCPFNVVYVYQCGTATVYQQVGLCCYCI